MFYPNCMQYMEQSRSVVTEIQSVSKSDIRNGDVFTTSELKEVAISQNSENLPLPIDTELERQMALGVQPRDMSSGAFIHGERPMLTDAQAEEFYNKLNEQPSKD